MREIRFRAWIKDAPMCYEESGMYYQGDQYLSSFIRRICDQYMTKNHESYLKFNLEQRLMQYTGLKDKNGREIYEGDIVKDFLDHPALIKFGPYSAGGQDYYASPAYGFFIQRITNGVEVEDDTETLVGNREVIGNIYENPELIKA